MNAEIIRASIEGITQEIDDRVSQLATLVHCVTGDEKRFIKPVKNPLPTIEKALQVNREVKKLRVIRKELQIMKLKAEITELTHG